MSDTTHNFNKTNTGVPIKAWTKGVQLEDAARGQLNPQAKDCRYAGKVTIVRQRDQHISKR